MEQKQQLNNPNIFIMNSPTSMLHSQPDNKKGTMSERAEALQSHSHLIKRKYSTLFTKIAVFAVVFLLAVACSDAYYLMKYAKISAKIKKNQRVQNGELADALGYLSSYWMWPFNKYFYEERIYELGKLEKWKEIIAEAQRALQYPENEKKFSIHYHKAMSECLLQKFKACKQTALRAAEKSDENGYKYLDDIYTILISNKIMTKAEIPQRRRSFKQYKDDDSVDASIFQDIRIL